MKAGIVIAAAAASLVPAQGFVVPSAAVARADTRMMAERINTAVDLESEKVATMEKLEPGSKKVYCRCWKSGTFPLCDGSHVKWNKETGDNVGPLIVSTDK